MSLAFRLLLLAVLATAAAALAVPAAHAAFGPVGSLNQLALEEGCVHDTPAEDCRDVRALAGVGDIAFDGPRATLFAPGAAQDTVAVLRRDPVTGSLGQAASESGCLEAESGGASVLGCRRAPNLDAASDVAVSPDDKFVYVSGSNGIAALSFSADSGLVPLPGVTACLSNTRTAQPNSLANRCKDARNLANVRGLVMAPDGRHVYAAVNGTVDQDGIAILSRNGQTGELSQSAVAGEGCISRGLKASGDADDPPPPDPAVERGCAGPLRGVGDPRDIAISRDGSRIYLVTHLGIAVLRRLADGRLEQLEGSAGCWTSAPTDTCQDGRALADPSQVALSGDGQSLYVSNGAQAVAHFIVNADGSLSQPSDTTGCIAGGGTVTDGTFPCAAARSLDGLGADIAVSPDGRTVAVAGSPAIGEVALLDRSAGGALSQAGDLRGCVSSTGAASGVGGGNGKCGLGRGLGASGMAYVPGAHQFYAAGGNSVAFFRREVAPTCESGSASTDTLTPVSVGFVCGDLNGDGVTIRVTGAPIKGTTGTPEGTKVVYTPKAGTSGLDTFLVTPNDGVNDGRFATASVNVAFRSPPVAPTPTPTPKPPTGKAPAAKIVTRRIRGDARHRARFTIECPSRAPVACQGKIEIITRGKELVVKGRRKRRVLLLSRSYRLAPGKRTRVTFKLPADARRAVRLKPSGRIALTVTVTAPAQGTLRKNTERGGLTLED